MGDLFMESQGGKCDLPDNRIGYLFAVFTVILILVCIYLIW